MKTLILLRHAKSSHANEQLTDFERPLNSRGIENSKRMKSVFFEHFPQPDIVLCSASVRTRQTAELLLDEYLLSKTIYSENLYLASTDEIDSEICSLDNTIETVMIIAHNPGLTEYYNRFDSLMNMPTCSLALITLEISLWSDIFSADGKINNFYYPKII